MILEAFFAVLWQILLELSPSLLLGLLIAGLLHEYLPQGLVHRGLNRPDLGSVARAALIGVPLPLCSCGVIPTALGLRRDGASPGATTAFLISTPQTGVDSVLVSASFLGWPFALFKLAAAFVTGLIGGVLVNRFTPPDPVVETPSPAAIKSVPAPPRGSLTGALRYALFELLAAIDLWILAGVVIAALLTFWLPADALATQHWTQGLGGMLLVLVISIPLYVCTTGSVPIAASLIAAGMPAGTALVFLMAGPATNVATLGALYRALGGRVLGLYLGTVMVLSMALGLGFDFLLEDPGTPLSDPHQDTDSLALGSAMVLILLLGFLWFRRLRRRLFPPEARSGEEIHPDREWRLKVEGMSCGHCVAQVKRTLESLDEVETADPDLASGLVRIRGTGLDLPVLSRAIEQAGYRVAGDESGGPPP